jgi:hypothetical protein
MEMDIFPFQVFPKKCFRIKVANQNGYIFQWLHCTSNCIIVTYKQSVFSSNSGEVSFIRIRNIESRADIISSKTDFDNLLHNVGGQLGLTEEPVVPPSSSSSVFALCLEELFSKEYYSSKVLCLLQ